MHACGHDVHASWAIGAAFLLAKRPAIGDVLVVLQPAEETGQGASAILKSGALDEVSAIFGAHVDRRFPIGQVVVQAGPLAAAADTFSITLRGRGAHGARPHESADPVLGAGLLIASLQGIVSRRVNRRCPQCYGGHNAGRLCAERDSGNRDPSAVRCVLSIPLRARCWQTKCAASRMALRPLTTSLPR